MLVMKCLLAQGSTFLDSCDFERENICGMVQGQGDKADWDRVSSAAGGPNTDYSNMGKCTGENDPTGIYMKHVEDTVHIFYLVFLSILALKKPFECNSNVGGQNSVPLLCRMFSKGQPKLI